MNRKRELNSQMRTLVEACQEKDARKRQTVVMKSMKEILEKNREFYQTNNDNRKKYHVLKMIIDVFMAGWFENVYDFPAILYNAMLEEEYASFKEFYGGDAQKYIVKYIAQYKLDEQDKMDLQSYVCLQSFKEDFIEALKNGIKNKAEKELKCEKKKTPAWAIVFGVLGMCCLALGLLTVLFSILAISSKNTEQLVQVQKLEREITVLKDEITEKDKEIKRLSAAEEQSQNNQDGSITIETGESTSDVSEYILDQKRNLRKEPDANSEKILSLEEGMEVSIVGEEENNWYEIVIKGYLKIDDINQTEDTE